MFISSSDFLSAGVNALVGGGQNLHVLFVTYNEVAGYDSGAVQTNKDGLTIQVQNGNLQYSPLTDFVYAVGTPLADIGCEAMDREARAAQKELESSLKIEYPTCAFLAVVYAGLSAFHEAVTMARKVKQDIPSAKIVIATCDCMIDQKSLTLRPMLKKKEIETVVVTSTCGGRGTMKKILEKIIEVWPAKVAV